MTLDDALRLANRARQIWPNGATVRDWAEHLEALDRDAATRAFGALRDAYGADQDAAVGPSHLDRAIAEHRRQDAAECPECSGTGALWGVIPTTPCDCPVGHRLAGQIDTNPDPTRMRLSDREIAHGHAGASAARAEIARQSAYWARVESLCAAGLAMPEARRRAELERGQVAA